MASKVVIDRESPPQRAILQNMIENHKKKLFIGHWSGAQSEKYHPHLRGVKTRNCQVWQCSHNNFSLKEKCGKLNQLQKKIFRFKDVMSSAGSGATKMVEDLTHQIRMDDACNIQVWRERDLHINHIFVLDIIAVLIFSSSHLEQRVIPRASPCPTTTWSTTPSTSVIGLAMTRRYHHDHLHHQHRQRHHAHYHVLNVSLRASSAQVIHEST